MAKQFTKYNCLRFFIGDVREKDRLHRALINVDYVIHAAATKIVPTAEYNPFECVKTNVIGAMNLIDAAIDQKVKKVVALSTDKASSPFNNWSSSKKRMGKGIQVPDGFSYASDTNNNWLAGKKLNNWLARLDKC